MSQTETSSDRVGDVIDEIERARDEPTKGIWIAEGARMSRMTRRLRGRRRDRGAGHLRRRYQRV
jgi:hypothetical protein